MAKQTYRIAKNFKPAIKGRLVLISVLFALYGLGLVARLFYLQILQHDELVARSAKQYLKTANIFYGRGIIYFLRARRALRRASMAARASALRRRMQGLARQASLNPDDGIDL